METRPKAQAATAVRVLQSFNTWAYKREQPTEPEVLLRSVASAVARKEPVSFVLYWGKGPRQTVGEPECACLGYLASMGRRIAAVYAPGATFTLIMTDTHAALNGHSRRNALAYFDAVAAVSGEFGFSTCLLGDLVDIADQVSPEAKADAPSAEMLADLELRAAKWYRGDGGIAAGAAEYYRMNMVEKRAVELLFPTSIFVTFNGRMYRELFPPSLPVFYMYSMRKGSSNKPWFEPRDGAPAGVGRDMQSIGPAVVAAGAAKRSHS